MSLKPQKTADMVAFTEEIVKRKLHFLRRTNLDIRIC